MKKKPLLASLLAAGALIIIVAGVQVWPSAQSEGGGWPVSKVALADVLRVQAPRKMEAVGELEAIRQVQLATEVAGQVTEIGFDSGQTVKAGQVLVQLNDAVEQAELVRGKARLRNAETMLSRTRQLLEQKAATREQYEQALAERDMAKGELARTQALIAQKSIRAPFAGTVGIRRVHAGQYLQAGQSVTDLVDAQTLNVNFSVAEQAGAWVQAGLPVAMRVDAYPERRFDAVVHAVNTVVDGSRTLAVQARLPNEDGVLRAGSFAAVSVSRPGEEQVLSIPESAVTYTAYGETVFTASKDEQKGWSVQRRAVKVGERWDGLAEVVSGLKVGEQVVVSGQLKLSDGMPVAPIQSDALPIKGETRLASGE